MLPETLMTAAGLEALQSELTILTEERRPELASRIKSARELGDLKENGEYIAAKEEQAFLETRILTIEGQIRTAKVIEHAGTDRVTVGSKVEVKDLDHGDVDTWTVTGVSEADPMENRISYESPIGSALMGQGVGAKVEAQLPNGTMRMEITKIG